MVFHSRQFNTSNWVYSDSSSLGCYSSNLLHFSSDLTPWAWWKYFQLKLSKLMWRRDVCSIFPSLLSALFSSFSICPWYSKGSFSSSGVSFCFSCPSLSVITGPTISGLGGLSPPCSAGRELKHRTGEKSL